MKSDFTRSLLWLWLGVAVLLGSCTKDADADAALLGKHWKLTEVGGADIRLSSFSYDSQSYIQFAGAGNTLQGLSACDEIGGQFSLDARNKTLSIMQLTVKPSTCSSPAFGGRYLAALPQTARYEVTNKELRLYNATQSLSPILVFRAE